MEKLIKVVIDRGVNRMIALRTYKASSLVHLCGAKNFVPDKVLVYGRRDTGGTQMRTSIVRHCSVVGIRGNVVPSIRETRKLWKVFNYRCANDALLDHSVTERRLRSPPSRKNAGGRDLFPKITGMRTIALASAVAPDAEWKNAGLRFGKKLHEEKSA